MSLCAFLLTSRILQLEQAREAEFEERRSFRDDCMRKVADIERKLQTVMREKELLKASLHEAEVEIARRLAQPIDLQLLLLKC